MVERKKGGLIGGKIVILWTNLLKIPYEKYWKFKYVIRYDLKSFLKQQWRLSYEFLDFGALAIIISLFGKADRQVKETNDRGSDQLVEHVSVKQLPWPDLAIRFIRNFLTIYFLSSSRCSLHFIHFHMRSRFLLAEGNCWFSCLTTCHCTVRRYLSCR